jgi:hypothetical protein
LATGWFGWGLSPEDAATHVAQLEALRRKHCGGSDPFEITLVPDDPHRPDVVTAFADAGVDRLVVVAATMPDDRTEEAIDLGASLLIAPRSSGYRRLS